jgi:hypothetical protein
LRRVHSIWRKLIISKTWRNPQKTNSKKSKFRLKESSGWKEHLLC